ncbi:MAG: ABC transporter ATP-binding protein [Peptoniphilaceae bacterium]
MKFLIKKLTKYWKFIILIILILFGQAFAELSLPDYMAKIVNVGIQQSGIESSVPFIITGNTFNKLKLVTNDEDFSKIDSIYKKENNLRNLDNPLYKKIEDKENTYFLTNLEKIKDKDLQRIFAKSLLVMKYIEEGQPQGMEKIGTKVEINLPKGDEAFRLLEKLPESKKSEILLKIDKTFNNLPESISLQSSMRLVAEEYEKLGIELSGIQNQYIMQTGLKMILIALLALLASISVGFIASRVAADFGRNLRQESFEKVISFSNREFDKFSTSSLITRSNNDIQQVQNMLVIALRIIFYAPILGIGGIYKALTTNVSMAWIIALAVVLIVGVVATIFSFAIPLFKKVQKLIDNLQLITREILNGLLVIRAFVTENHEEKRFSKANRVLTDTNQRIANIMASMDPFIMVLMNSTSLLIVWIGAHEINQGLIQVGDMMAFMQYSMQIIMSFLMITMVSIMLPRALVSLNRVAEVVNEEIEIKNKENPIKLKEKINGNIEFKNVYFKYDNAPENALKNINLKINKGEITAFIGSTGSGKSALINLIPRFYDVTQGQVLIDGIDVRDIDIKDLRDKIGFVPQKTNLFTGTVESNIRIGKNENIDEKRVEKAINMSQSKEFVSKFKEGLNHRISQSGSNVSGGQKQRLSIARAIASKPEIYIFDDSFSALDFRTDYNLRKALNEESKNSTMIIVAQRIGTIINADNIVVLEDGEIVGQGKHSELIKNCNVYKQIASSQLKKEDME